MRTGLITAIVFTCAFASGRVSAQLGPKEGTNLAPTEINRVKIGQPAPDFSLEDVDGHVLTLSDYRGKKSVVLVFYRGYW